MKLPSASEIAKLASEEPIFSQVKKRRKEMEPEGKAQKELQDAFRQGLELGFLRGFQQGKKEGVLDIVRRMVGNECTISFLSKITGWSGEQISKAQPRGEE